MSTTTHELVVEQIDAHESSSASQVKPEKWRKIHDYPDYLISSLARVMRVTPSRHPRFENTWPGKVLRPGIDRDGYPQVALVRPDGKTITKKLHTLVAAAFIGIRPSGMDINHINGEKRDARPENLEYCSRSANMEHAYQLGLSRQKKLTEYQVQQIRHLYALKVFTQAELSAHFSISKTQVWNIIHSHQWKHVVTVTQHHQLRQGGRRRTVCQLKAQQRIARSIQREQALREQKLQSHERHMQKMRARKQGRTLSTNGYETPTPTC